MDKHNKAFSEGYVKPQLIQTLNAYLHNNPIYIPPGQNIRTSLPLDPESDVYKECWHEPGDVLYASPIGHPYYFHREPDGRLNLSDKEAEPDSTVWVDDQLANVLTHQLYIPIFGFDQQNNFYAIGNAAREIMVYTQNRSLIAKYKLTGSLQCWYLNSDGVMCVITSNGSKQYSLSKK